MILIHIFILLFKLHCSYGGKTAGINGIINSGSNNFTEFSSILYNIYKGGEKTLSTDAFQAFFNCTVGIDKCNKKLSIISEQSQTECNPGSENNLRCKLLHECVPATDVLSLLQNDSNPEEFITEEEFKTLLPIVTYQSQGQFCDQYPVSISAESKLPTSAEVWGYGLLFVTLISSCSLAGVSVIPLMAKDCYQKLLTLLIGLAAGSLISSAVFHLIPQAFKITSKGNGEHSYLFVSLGVLAGIWGFFMIERFISIVLRRQRQKKQAIAGSSSVQEIIEDSKYSVNVSPSYNNGSFNVDNDKETIDFDDQNDSITASNGDGSCNGRDVKLILDSQTQAIRASFGHEQKAEKVHTHEVRFKQGEDSVVATVAWMIIFGDGFHNFIDGVSIGAAFQQSILTGISISLAVMCEELPHELGDFAVLLNSGMTMKQALFYNFLSATTCYLGMFVGILLGEFTQDSTYIFALAGGMFLYIALSDMFPEMRETAEQSIESGPRELISVLILQNIGMITGVLILFFLAYYQDSLSLE